MAVINAFTDAAVAAGKLGNPAHIMPGQIFGFACTFETAASDDNGSKYKIAKVGANMIPLQLYWNSDAIAGFTSADMGFYKENGDAAEVDILMAAHDVNGGFAFGSELDCLHDMPLTSVGKKVWELVGATVSNKEEAYVLAITANAAASAAGTVSIRGIFIQG